MSDLTELNSLFAEDGGPSEEFKPNDFTFRLKPRTKVNKEGKIGPYREKYRPQRFNEIVPTCSVEQLRNQVDNPGASQIFLMEGRSGTGKTTCARILARALVCSTDNTYEKPCLECKNCKEFDKNPIDLLEINTADKNKVDDIRNLVVDMNTMCAHFPKKVYILDEVQRLTKDAQQVLLTELEEPHRHLVVFLCTTDVSKINKALVDRSCRITFSDLETQHARDIIDQIFKYENLSASDEVKESLFFQAGGSIRALLNNIQAYSEKGFNPSNWAEDETSAEVKTLYKAITGGDWGELSMLLAKPNTRKDSEGLRMGLENYFRFIMLKKQNIDEAAKLGSGLMRISGSLINSDTSSISMYNNFVLKCLRACTIFK
jgi:DNA polymerase III subunit gamma/tau